MSMKIAFGAEGGHLIHNVDRYEYLKINEAFLPILEMGCNFSFVFKVLSSRVTQAIAAPKPTDKAGLGAFTGMAHKEVAQRFGPDAKPDQPDMLGSFIRNGLTREECESESMIQILAGTDSTATAIQTTLWYIISAPVVYAKLSREVQSAAENGLVSAHVIKDAEAKKLPYLQACISEGLRMLLPLNGLGTRVCPEGGYDFQGIHIPAGTEVGWGGYYALRKEKYFGPDAHTFRPERFLDGDPATIKEFERMQDTVFAGGRFTCLGKSIALVEMRKAIFELMRGFDYTVVNPLEAIACKANGSVVQNGTIVRAWPKVQQ